MRLKQHCFKDEIGKGIYATALPCMILQSSYWQMNGRFEFNDGINKRKRSEYLFE